MKYSPLLLAALALAVFAGCKPKVRHSTDLERKQAASAVSEAQFAVTLRDYARALPLYEKATQLCPDIAEYWLSLGVTQIKLSDKAKAKVAYEGALKACRAAYATDAKDTGARLQEIQALALLGREKDARAALATARKELPNDFALRKFEEEKRLDQMLADPGFKAIAL